MSTPAELLESLAAGTPVSELVSLRKTVHLGPMRGSQTLTVRSDLKVIASQFEPAKGIGKQDPPRELGAISPAQLQTVAHQLLAVGVHLPPPNPPGPGGAEVEFGMTVGEERLSVRKPSFSISRDPNWSAASLTFDAIRKSFDTP